MAFVKQDIISTSYQGGKKYESQNYIKLQYHHPNGYIFENMPKGNKRFVVNMMQNGG